MGSISTGNGANRNCDVGCKAAEKGEVGTGNESPGIKINILYLWAGIISTLPTLELRTVHRQPRLLSLNTPTYTHL